MDFKIKQATEQTTKKYRRPPNYSSRAVRIRLATLVALLGVAFLAMHEAGKPETWERLGFGSTLPQSELRPAEQQPAQSSGDSDEEQPAWLEPFWRTEFHALNVVDRKLLLEISDAVVKQQKLAINVDGGEKLLKRLDSRFTDFIESRQLFPQQDVDDCQRLIQELKIYLSHADRAKINEQRIKQLQLQLESYCYDFVEDRSSLGRSAESLAWSRSWKRLAADGFADTTTNVSMVQLTGQPDAYRGHAVRIGGTVRGIERLVVASDALPFKHYDVLWIQPQEISRTPYCVYVHTLPNGFPASDGPFKNINEAVSIDGIFFKLRSYVATNNKIETCPLLVAETVSWNPQPPAASVARWQPPFWLLMMIVIAMPILAGLLAYGVYRSTRTGPLRLGNSDQAEIALTLHGFSEDQSILSDRERIGQLQQQEEETP